MLEWVRKSKYTLACAIGIAMMPSLAVDHYLAALRVFEAAHRAEVLAMSAAGTSIMTITAASVERRESLRRLRSAWSRVPERERDGLTPPAAIW
jgi:hypothetical protein